VDATPNGRSDIVRHTLTGAVTLLALAACGSPAAEPSAVPAVPAASPAAGSAGVVAAGDGTTPCPSPAGYTVEHPADWTANDDGVLPPCSWFAPEEFVVPEASDVRTAPVTLRVESLPYAEVAAPMPDEVSRTAVEVDGRPAVRAELVTTGGLYPAGTRITSYAVDLGDRTLVADAVEVPGGDHERDVAVLDAMVESLELDGVARA
jgi:hypothetical protein